MIKKLLIKNFQSHTNTTIEFTDKINIFHGISDSGKSVIIRALLCLFNREDFYLTYGKKEGFIKVIFDDGNEIERVYKSKKILKCPKCKEKLKDDSTICSICNYVIPIKPSEDYYIVNGEKKEKFGRKLPEFIKNITKIYPYSFNNDEIFINVFEQHDVMFFIDKTYNGEKRSNLISSLVIDSEKIDKLTKQYKSDIYNINIEIKSEKKNIEREKEQLEKINQILPEAKEINKKIKELKESKSNIEREKEQLEKINNRLKKLQDIDKLIKKVEKIAIYSDKLKNIILKLEKMSLYINDLKVLKIELKRIEKIKNIKIPNKINYDFENINTLYKKIISLKNSKKIIEQTDDEIISLKSNKEKMVKKLEMVNKEFEKYLKSNDGICPIIKDRFKKDCIRRLLNNEM